MILVEFQYNGEDFKIKAQENETMEKICKEFSKKVNNDINQFNFLYSGKQIDLTKFIDEIINPLDKQRKKMDILVMDKYSTITKNKSMIKSNHIICPTCKECARIDFENYNIKIYDCINNHISYILFDEFENTQEIDESKIICQECGKKNKSNIYNKLMFFCNSCNKNLCPLCKEKHNKSHQIINYDEKYYICKKHNRSYNSYCNTCQKDKCVLCESDHKFHNEIPYSQIIPNSDSLNNIFSQKIKKSIDEFNNKISLLINKLENIKMNLEICLKIIENIIKKYSNNNNHINYKILKNLNGLDSFSEKSIVQDLQSINFEKDNFIQIISKIHRSMNTKVDQLTLSNNFSTININQNNNIQNSLKFIPLNLGCNNNSSNINNINFGNNTIINFNNNNEFHNNINKISILQKNPNNFGKNSNNFKKVIFPMKGLKNIGQINYMNAALQCLLHVSELSAYFLIDFPKEQNILLSINKNSPSQGDISRAYYNLVNGVYEYNENNIIASMPNPKIKSSVNIKNKKISNSFGIGLCISNLGDYYKVNDSLSNCGNSFSPIEFKNTLGFHNGQFITSNTNDSKELILYLLEALHKEMNYFGDRNIRLNCNTNQYDIVEAYNHFTTTNNSNNFSKIYQLFYGTHISTIICTKCQKKLYNFEKFKLMSFRMYYYNHKQFRLIDGFNDNCKPIKLTGDNQYFCNYCNELKDALAICQIIEPPIKLLIYINYGENKKYQPSSIQIDDIINITKFIPYDYKQQIKYQILCICTCYSSFGSNDYVAYCRNKETNKWYGFNDSVCTEVKNKNDIYGGSPYLLLYERINA